MDSAAKYDCLAQLTKSANAYVVSGKMTEADQKEYENACLQIADSMEARPKDTIDNLVTALQTRFQDVIKGTAYATDYKGATDLGAALRVFDEVEKSQQTGASSPVFRPILYA
jgi:hypothetical protein